MDADSPMSEHQAELMAGYVLNSLSPDEAAEFEQQLRTNPALEQELQELREVMGLMAYHPPMQKASAQLRSRILQAAQAPGKVIEQPRRQVFHWSSAWPYGAIVALSLCTVWLGIENYQLRQNQTALTSELSTLENTPPQTFMLKGTQAQATAVANVILDPGIGRAVVAVQNLPSLPADQRYYLWAFTANKKVLCGTFNTDATGQLVTNIDVEDLEYGGAVKFMRVSQEPIAASPQSAPKVLVMTSES